MLSAILYLDSRLTTIIARIFPHNWFFDSIFSFFSLQGIYLAIWIIALVYFYLKDKKNRRREFILLLISLTVTLLSVHFFKLIFERPRPWTLLPPEDIRCYERDFSFPSAHAAGAMSGAVILSFFHKKQRYLYYLLAFLISLSRIFWQCHYLLDLLFGASLGYSVSKVVLFVSTYSIQNQKAKKT